ncbi:MAG: transposase [Elusimicrobiota bacterium]|nr:transposase [Elusimicrobiota bacterium]
MPRQARIDIPGQLYHVMSRGIERRKIFLSEEDCADFLERMGVWLKKSGGKCLAWCLIPNHFHFLLLRGDRPLSEVMHHVMTGYAVNFNGRHHRVGHLFQNRYKAIICDADEYLLGLVPYIHLNPLRAKLVGSLAELENYKWCGHACAVNGAPDEVLDRAELLGHFSGDEETAVDKYKALMKEKAADSANAALSAGGLQRSLGGAGNALPALRAGDKARSDPRILGEGDFVEAILRAANEALAAPLKSREELLKTVEQSTGVPRKEILRPSHCWAPAQARALYCYLCKEKGGVSGAELRRELKIGQSAVSRLAAKGRKLAETQKLVI